MKTAKQLGIKQWEFDALIKTRDLLMTQKVKNPDDLGSYGGLPSGKHPTKFNMNHAVQEYNCGTALCIGGLAFVFGGLRLPVKRTIELTLDQSKSIDAYVSSRYSDSLEDLYYPPTSIASYDSFTPQEAVQAIDNFLNSGNPSWGAIVDSREDSE